MYNKVPIMSVRINRMTHKRTSTGSNRDHISFINYTQKYCVCIVDMVNSTQATAKIRGSQKIRDYYSIFLNTISSIIRFYGGKVTKYVGDSLVFYFPKTADSSNKLVFLDVLECCMTILAANSIINAKLSEEELPAISYRISADYGIVELATSAVSNSVDIFGSPVNSCAKINDLASSNGMVIGQELYQILYKYSSFFSECYVFREITKFHDSTNKKLSPYHVYSIHGRARASYIQRDHDHTKTNNVTTKLSLVYQLMGGYLKRQRQLRNRRRQNDPFNILLIDDSMDVLLTFKEILQIGGYKIKAISDSEEALRHFSRKEPSHYDLVIMDIRMPNLNGFQLYNKLKAISPNTKVLFITALDAIEELVSLLPEVELKDILRKPIPREHFLSKVSAMLQKLS
jgi:CheY-like chemotaxis protein